MAEVDEATKPEIEKLLLAKLKARLEMKVPHRGRFMKMKESLERQLKTTTDETAKGKVREKLYRLNNLMNEYNSSFDYFSWSYHSSLKQLKKDIKLAQTNTTGGNPSAVTTATTATVTAERSNRTPKDKPVGIKVDELVMENLLLHRNGIRSEFFNVVGIIGAEEVGKTTLAKSIFDKEEVAKQFRPRIWISMADDPAKQETNLQIAIANRILRALGISDEAINKIHSSAANEQILSDLVHAIRIELMGKRYLIVLDDASMKDSYSEQSSDDRSLKEWCRDLRSDPTPNCELHKKLGFAFPKGAGGTVLVIGWPENVVKAMLEGDESAIHRLLPLEDPTLCWNICEKEAKGGEGEGMTGNDEQKVEAEVVERSKGEQKVKAEVVRRSNGLPGAARLMGKIVKKKNDQQQQAAT